MNLRRLILTLYVFLILGLGVAGGVYLLEARAEYAKLKRVEEKNRQLLAAAEAKLKAQEKILERMRNDPEYLADVIRRKLGYAKPDEVVFKLLEN